MSSSSSRKIAPSITILGAIAACADSPTRAQRSSNPFLATQRTPPAGVLLPFHLDTTLTSAACTHDITHDWVPQHQSWDKAAMDGFVTSRPAINANDALLAMSHYTRDDIPFY